MPLELLPATELPRLNVLTTWREATPESLESFVTSPVEAAVQQVRGTERIVSTSEVRPVPMTSMTMIFGLLPLMLFSHYSDQNLWHTLGYALIGGLAASTLLVLTVAPALYLICERGPQRRRLDTDGGCYCRGLALASTALRAASQ
jgi:multidrug efflux pump subunit AcrB